VWGKEACLCRVAINVWHSTRNWRDDRHLLHVTRALGGPSTDACSSQLVFVTNCFCCRSSAQHIYNLTMIYKAFTVDRFRSYFIYSGQCFWFRFYISHLGLTSHWVPSPGFGRNLAILQFCVFGSGIRCLFDPQIRDKFFLNPRSNPQSSYSIDIKFGLKVIEFFVRLTQIFLYPVQKLTYFHFC